MLRAYRASPFDQSGFAARFDWAETGLRTVMADVEVLVLVHVLSFTTAVEVAVSRGASVYPYRVRDATAVSFAERHAAVLAVGRRHVSTEHPIPFHHRRS